MNKTILFPLSWQAKNHPVTHVTWSFGAYSPRRSTRARGVGLRSGVSGSRPRPTAWIAPRGQTWEACFLFALETYMTLGRWALGTWMTGEYVVQLGWSPGCIVPGFAVDDKPDHHMAHGEF